MVLREEEILLQTWQSHVVAALQVLQIPLEMIGFGQHRERIGTPRVQRCGQSRHIEVSPNHRTRRRGLLELSHQGQLPWGRMNGDSEASRRLGCRQGAFHMRQRPLAYPFLQPPLDACQDGVQDHAASQRLTLWVNSTISRSFR